MHNAIVGGFERLSIDDMVEQQGGDRLAPLRQAHTDSVFESLEHRALSTQPGPRPAFPDTLPQYSSYDLIQEVELWARSTTDDNQLERMKAGLYNFVQKAPSIPKDEIIALVDSFETIGYRSAKLEQRDPETSSG